MSSDWESDALRRITASKDFAGAILVADDVDDWSLAKQFGEILVRVLPGYLIGHLILARAYRHIGEPQLAAEQIETCRRLISDAAQPAISQEWLLPVLAEEEKHLARAG